MRVKVLDRLAPHSSDTQSQEEEATKVPKILTKSYVREINRGISYRIQRSELSHADSTDLAARAHFR